MVRYVINRHTGWEFPWLFALLPILNDLITSNGLNAGYRAAQDTCTDALQDTLSKVSKNIPQISPHSYLKVYYFYTPHEMIPMRN